MAVERITPQLVKKGKGKKRPGYRGPGGYQGGGGRSGRSSGPAGGASAGGNYGGNRNPSQSYGGSGQGGATRPNPHTTSGTSKTSKVTAKDIARSKREFIQNLNHNNAVRAAQTGQKFTPYKGGSRPKGGMSGLGNLLMSGIGMLMGIPGLGLLTGGFDKLKGGLGSLNDKIQSTDFARSTSLMDYLDAKKYGGIDARDRKADQTMREARGIQTAMDMRPTTLDPREMARMGLQMPTAPMSKPTFSDPFANTVGTTTKVNAPASDAVSSYSYGTAGASIPNPNLAPTPVENVIQDAYSGIKNIGTKGNNFLDSLYNADLINQLGYQAFKNYPSDSATGPLSDARHMAAMNELSKSLSPFDNKFGSFIGDTAATALGALNELPDFFRDANPAMLAAGLATKNPVTMRAGLDDKAVAAGMEDLSANYAGTYGTPNTTSAQQIYDQVFNTNKFASGYADGGIASMFTRRG